MRVILFNRNMLYEVWIPAIFSVILLFCLFQLGLSIYQSQLQHSLTPHKLHAISAFAS